MDSKGRIVIPEDVRKELGLNEGRTVRLRLEKSARSGSALV
ncbi:MAG: AbrB/MazE/SpoVT family DNA-binding domain-containing protein, partial [Nitrososphaerales archaeon]